ncbi:MAG: hypothetical protein ACKPJH_21315 [Dolichospermum sp.]
MITPQTSHNKRSHFIPSTSNSDSYGALRYRISFYLYQKGDRSFKTIPKKRFLRSASLSHFILPTSNSDSYGALRYRTSFYLHQTAIAS